jgi:hypothetical protein
MINIKICLNLIVNVIFSSKLVITEVLINLDDGW